MVYATQAPKALHNLVTGNAMTQFFGLLKAQVQCPAPGLMETSNTRRIDCHGGTTEVSGRVA